MPSPNPCPSLLHLRHERSPQIFLANSFGKYTSYSKTDDNRSLWQLGLADLVAPLSLSLGIPSDVHCSVDIVTCLECPACIWRDPDACHAPFPAPVDRRLRHRLAAVLLTWLRVKRVAACCFNWELTPKLIWPQALGRWPVLSSPATGGRTHAFRGTALFEFRGLFPLAPLPIFPIHTCACKIGNISYDRHHQEQRDQHRFRKETCRYRPGEYSRHVVMPSSFSH